MSLSSGQHTSAMLSAGFTLYSNLCNWVCDKDFLQVLLLLPDFSDCHGVTLSIGQLSSAVLRARFLCLDSLFFNHYRYFLYHHVRVIYRCGNVYWPLAVMQISHLAFQMLVPYTTNQSGWPSHQRASTSAPHTADTALRFSYTSLRGDFGCCICQGILFNASLLCVHFNGTCMQMSFYEQQVCPQTQSWRFAGCLIALVWFIAVSTASSTCSSGWAWFLQ